MISFDKAAVKLGAALALVGVAYIVKMSKAPRGIKNNNPLNLRETGIGWMGKIGDDGEFTQFESPFMGIRAAARNLRTYRGRGIDTVQAIIQTWAPPTENDTQSYIESVSQKTGLSPYEPLKTEDYPKLVEAMIYHENGQQPYDKELIGSATMQGLA